MKFKELQKIAQKADYSVEKNNFRTSITKKSRRGEQDNIIAISELDIGFLDISMAVQYVCDFEVVKAAIDYATTPPEVR